MHFDAKADFVMKTGAERTDALVVKEPVVGLAEQRDVRSTYSTSHFAKWKDDVSSMLNAGGVHYFLIELNAFVGFR